MAIGTDQALKNPTVLLLGASSQIGIFAIPRLVHAGFKVFAVSRKGKPKDYPAFEQVDWLNETEAIQATQSCQYLVSAGPLELAKKFLTISRSHTRHPGSPSRHPGSPSRHPGSPSRHPGLDPGSILNQPTPDDQNGFRVKPGKTNPPVTPDPTAVTSVPVPVVPAPSCHPGLDPGSILNQPTPDDQNGFRVKPGKTNPPVTPDLIRGPFQAAVIFSSSSVKTKQSSDNPAERSQMQTMLGLESDIQRAAQDSSLKLVIFRPTLIYGCGLDTNISRLANWICRFGFMPVNGKAAGLRQPVHADDLAAVAITAMLSKDALPGVMYLTGGDTLSYADMIRNIFTAMDKPARIISLPEWLFVSLARFAGISRISQGINTEMVKRQRLDLVFDDRKARELLNYNPRPFTPTKEDFSLPDC